jgi:non-specific serine/threonine protein kinase/serine/threonine-protein kinase
MDDQPKPSNDSKAPQPTAETIGIFAARAASRSIGPYRLLELLGEGGMGEVWLAEQTEPLHRTVALKLIKTGMDTKAVIARFESERQALALMEHPCIAKVFDAGSTADGRPYFVMEYVPGQPINEYCDRHRLTVKQRLDLFTQVCEGVQHAHQKAIIHRDLKPSNVLVQEIDNKPAPKIIDFGLAKATGQRLTDVTLYTEVGSMVGTPAYMSPEQADQNERNIDTRTDVYSLGVILYELLAGVLPFGPKELREAGVDAMLRKIRDEEPPRPSTKVRSQGDTSKTAEMRQEEPQAFIRHLRGELDWIVMKALEKDRSRRYGSPSDLAADVRRHLHDEPVLAGPPSTVYRAKKFVRRHRFGVTTAGVMVLLLVAFAATMAIQARRIAKERDRANREAEASKRVAAFMTEMFKVSDPSVAKGNSITAREILDKASHDIESGLARDPELQGRLMTTMAETYVGLGLLNQSQALLERTIPIQTKQLGPENVATLHSTEELAWVLSETSRLPEAEKLARKTLETEKRVLPADDPETLKTMGTLAWILEKQGKYDDAEKLEKAALETEKRVSGPDAKGTIDATMTLAATEMSEGHYADSEQLLREGIDTIHRVYGPDYPTGLVAQLNLAVALQADGKVDEANKILEQNIPDLRRVLGPEHPKTLYAMFLHGYLLGNAGHPEEAVTQLRECYEIQLRKLGPDNLDTIATQHSLADDLGLAGHYEEAEKLERKTLEDYRRVLGPDHPHTTDTLQGLGLILTHAGHYADGQKYFQEAIDITTRTGRKDDFAFALYERACADAIAGKRDLALEHLKTALDKGFGPPEAIEGDNDMKSLRNDPKFVAMMADARAAQKPK